MTANAPKPLPDAPVAPEHLSDAARAWWEAIAESYILEPHHLRLLTEAAGAWDRVQQARRLLDADGLVTAGRYGPVAHPAVGIELRQRTLFARLMRELDLDGEPLPDPRPPRRGGRR